MTHQKWHDHPFSQRNQTSKIVVEVKVEGNGKEGLDKILKGWGKQCRGGWSRNIGGARNTLPTMTHKKLFWKKYVLIV